VDVFSLLQKGFYFFFKLHNIYIVEGVNNHVIYYSLPVINSLKSGKWNVNFIVSADAHRALFIDPDNGVHTTTNLNHFSYRRFTRWENFRNYILSDDTNFFIVNDIVVVDESS